MVDEIFVGKLMIDGRKITQQLVDFIEFRNTSENSSKFNSTKAQNKIKNIYIALSGGIDSSALLHIIFSNKDLLPEDTSITAIYIDHDLQSDSSKWGEHCRKYCDSLGIGFESIRVKVDYSGKESLELAAREARYDIFKDKVSDGGVILMGHHQDDNIETFFHRIVRGSGVKGLSSIPVFRELGNGYIYRPILDCSRESLKRYIESNNISIIEDPSNNSSDFDRNFIRNEVITLLKKRWRSLNNTVSRTISHCNEASDLLNELAFEDYQKCKYDDGLSLEEMEGFSFPRKKNLIRYWIDLNGLIQPSTIALENGLDSILNAANDRAPEIHWDYAKIQRFKGVIYIEKPLATSGSIIEWDLKEDLTLDGIGTLTSTKIDSENKNQFPYALDLSKVEGKKITIRFRQGGEKCRPCGRGNTHSLKKLFQEFEVPPWKRDKIPLLYVGDEIAIVIGYCHCEPYCERVDQGEDHLVAVSLIR